MRLCLYFIPKKVSLYGLLLIFLSFSRIVRLFRIIFPSVYIILQSKLVNYVLNGSNIYYFLDEVYTVIALDISCAVLHYLFILISSKLFIVGSFQKSKFGQSFYIWDRWKWKNVGKDCYKTQWWVSSILLNACWSSQGALWVAEHRHLTLGFCGVRVFFGVGSFSETLGPLNKNLRTHQLKNYLDKFWVQ